jgi:beta-glucosidase/6-phospho-beta-glucosidase/beta-galactosidase
METQINWDKLSLSMKNNIAETLINNIKYLQQNYWNSEDLRNTINDTIYQPKFTIQYKNVDNLYNQLTQIGWGISEINIKRLMKIVKNNNELDPILLNNGFFFDGGHRLTVYKRLRKKNIATIDIHFMLKFDWEKWDNGEINF